MMPSSYRRSLPVDRPNRSHSPIPVREASPIPAPLPARVVAHGWQRDIVRPRQGGGSAATATGDPSHRHGQQPTPAQPHRHEPAESRMPGNGTSGSVGGLGKRTGCKADTTPQADPPRTTEPGDPPPHRRRRHLSRPHRPGPPGGRRARRATRRIDRDAPLHRPGHPRQKPPHQDHSPEPTDPEVLQDQLVRAVFASTLSDRHTTCQPPRD
jgi:hypothetical protein